MLLRPHPLQFLIFTILCVGNIAMGQTGLIRGTITDSVNNPIQGVNIVASPGGTNASTNEDGYYQINLDKGDYTLTISHVRYRTITRPVRIASGEQMELDFQLSINVRILQGVDVEERQRRNDPGGITEIDAQSLENAPTGTGEFTKILATLGSVVSNNELSSSYSVRGGNFDENLIYVNGIQIYRPFLIRAGQQEGLSFVNTNLVKNIKFYAGGWDSRYGDKLSSVLNIEYREPEKFGGSITFGLLGGNVHYENFDPKRNISYTLGLRHKDCLLYTSPSPRDS